MALSIEVARFLVHLASRERELITQMRLHKLLYYAQVWSLTQRDKPLFTDKIEAWTHGPVVREVYPAFRNYGDAPIAACNDENEIQLDAADQDFVKSIWESYKANSATQLRTMTHREMPWRKTREDLGDDEKSDRESALELMTGFFRKEYAKHQIPGLELDRIRKAEEDIAAGRYVEFDRV